MKEKGPSPDFVPDRRARWDAKQEAKKPGMSRRGFLMGVGAFGAATMIPQQDIRALTHFLEPGVVAEPDINLEKQKALEHIITVIQNNLRKPEVLEALNGRGNDPISVLLGAVEIPILPEHLEGTIYDVKELHTLYPVQVKREVDGGNTLTGNGILWRNEKTLLTAAHVIHEFENDYPIPDIDIEEDEVGTRLKVQNRGQVVPENNNLTDADIHGQLISVVGIDPDKTSDENGHKTYAGVAVKITPGLARLLAGNSDYFFRKLSNSLMVVLPPGEAKPEEDQIASTIIEGSINNSRKPLRAAGMSGSPAFVHRNGEWGFAGILWGVNVLPDKTHHRTLEFGFLHGIDKVRHVQQVKAQMS